MPSRKLVKYIARLLCILSIFTIFFVVIVKIVLYDESLPTQIPLQTFHKTSNSCHSVIIPLTSSSEQRCYPLLINFAHQCCRRAQRRNCLTGLQFGIQQCVMFNKLSLNTNPTFVNRNKNILERKRGAGYWLWKPYLIFQELYLALDGDIILYSDALVNFVANISYLIELTTKQDMIIFELTGFKVRVNFSYK